MTKIRSVWRGQGAALDAMNAALQLTIEEIHAD